MDNKVIELMKQIEDEFTAACYDSDKFVSGNNSAGTRVRKYMQNIKNLAQRVRVEVQEQKHAVVAQYAIHQIKKGPSKDDPFFYQYPVSLGSLGGGVSIVGRGDGGDNGQAV